MPHALAFYTDVVGTSEDHDPLTAIADFILAHKVDGPNQPDHPARDRTMRRLARLDDRETEKVCQQLDALGWLDRVPGPRPMDKPSWNINPEVHRLFEDRARASEERRLRDEEISRFLQRKSLKGQW